MGIIKKQGLHGTVAIYLGLLIGAFNTIIFFPAVFPNNPDAMGMVQLILSYSLVLGTIIGAGFPSGVVYFFPKLTQHQKQVLFGFALAFSLVLVILGFLCVFLFPDFIAGFITKSAADSKPYLIDLMVLVVFYMVFELLAGIMQSARIVVFPVVLKEVGRKLTITFILLATYLQWIDGVEQMMFFLVVFYGIMVFWLGIDFWRKTKLSLSFQFSKIDYKQISKYSFTLLFTAAIYMLISRIDVMMLGSLMETTAHVAFYTIAFQIGSVVWTPAKSLNRATRPLLAEFFANNQVDKINQTYHQSVSNQFFVGAFIYLMIVVNLDFIYSFVPDGYSFGKNVVWFIATGFLVNVLFGPNGMLVSLSHLYKIDFYLNVAMLVVIVVLNYFLIPEYGVFGAAAGTAFTTTIYNLSKSFLVYKHFSIKPIKTKQVMLIGVMGAIIVAHFILPDFGLIANMLINSVLVSVIFSYLLFKTKLAIELKEMALGVINKTFK